VVILVVVAAGAVYVSLNQGGQNSTTGTTHTAGPIQCTSPFIHVDANFTLGPQFNNFLGGIAYDPHNGLLYVTATSESNAVYVVDPTKNSVVDKVTGVGANPTDVA
jgi:YVTN family beta-propeller protein